MALKNKLSELKHHDLNCNIFNVYDYDGLSIQVLLSQFFTKIIKNTCTNQKKCVSLHVFSA